MGQGIISGDNLSVFYSAQGICGQPLKLGRFLLRVTQRRADIPEMVTEFGQVKRLKHARSSLQKTTFVRGAISYLRCYHTFKREG